MPAHSLRTDFDLKMPFWQCAEIFSNAGCGFLLDSGRDTARLDRYSYIGGQPSALIRGWRAKDGNPTMQDRKSVV